MLTRNTIRGTVGDVPDLTIGHRDEENFVANLKTLRQRAGMNQSELASLMRSRGWESFRQTTISRMENGEQSVRIGEARALAHAVNSTVEEMVQPPSDIDAKVLVRDLTSKAIDAHEEAIVSLAMFLNAQRKLASGVAEVGVTPSGGTKAMLNQTLEDINKIAVATFSLEGVAGDDASQDRAPVMETEPSRKPFSKFELYQDKAGKYRFRLKNSAGQIILVSSEAYESKAAAHNAINLVQGNAKGARTAGVGHDG